MNNLNKIIKVSDMKYLSIDALIEAYKNGYRIEGTDAPIEKMETRLEALGTCPIAAKSIGQTVSLSAVTTGGTAPYGVWFYKGGTQLNPSGIANVGEGAVATFTYTLLSTDGGSQTFSANVVDSCPSGSKTSTDSCVVTVTEAAPVEAGISPILILGLAVGFIYMTVKKKKM